MKRTFQILFFSLMAGALSSCDTSKTDDNDPWGKIDPGKVEAQSVAMDRSMHSNAMGRDMTYSVWLPNGYDEKETYPFLYLLHGYEDGNQNATWNRCWLDKGNAAYLADQYQKSGGVAMVIIMPNGLDKFYIWDNYETYFEEELMAKVEADFHCNGKRAIAGLSMGGFGTLWHATKFPTKFTYAYAMSPAASMYGMDPKNNINAASDKSVFPKFTIEVGKSDMTVNNSDSKKLYDHMVKNGITCDWIERDGTHDWAFWKGCLPKALQKVGASFK